MLLLIESARGASTSSRAAAIVHVDSITVSVSSPPVASRANVVVNDVCTNSLKAFCQCSPQHPLNTSLAKENINGARLTEKSTGGALGRPLHESVDCSSGAI